jgi:hypothetical protein
MLFTRREIIGLREARNSVPDRGPRFSSRRHPRFPRAGTYVFTTSIESDSIVSYELRCSGHRQRGVASHWSFGDAAARRSLVGTHRVAPAALVESIPAPRLEAFAVQPATYRVLLARDTTYMTCGNRGTSVMHAGQHVDRHESLVLRSLPPFHESGTL